MTQLDALGNYAPLPPGGTPIGQPRGQGNFQREGAADPTDATLGWTPSVEPAEWVNTVTRFKWTWFTASGATKPSWHKGSAALNA